MVVVVLGWVGRDWWDWAMVELVRRKELLVEGFSYISIRGAALLRWEADDFSAEPAILVIFIEIVGTHFTGRNRREQ